MTHAITQERRELFDVEIWIRLPSSSRVCLIYLAKTRAVPESISQDTRAKYQLSYGESQ